MEDRQALKIHGHQFSSESGSESDSGKSDFDLEYFKALPPVHRIDPTKIVQLSVSDNENSLNASNIGGSSEQSKTHSLQAVNLKFFSESGSDSGQSDFNREYHKALPPVRSVDPTKVIVLSENSLNPFKIGGSSIQAKIQPPKAGNLQWSPKLGRDIGKSDFEREYHKALPPVRSVDPTKLIVPSENSLNPFKIGGSSIQTKIQSPKAGNLQWFSSESDNDSSKSNFDRKHHKALPPVRRVDVTKVKGLRARGSENCLNASNIGSSFIQPKIQSLKDGNLQWSPKSDSDIGKSGFDREYHKALPPVSRVDLMNVMLRAKGSENSLNASNIVGSSVQAKTQSLKAGNLHRGTTTATTYDACSSSSSIVQPVTTSAEVPATSSNTRVSNLATLRNTDQACHNPRLSGSNTLRLKNENKDSSVCGIIQVRSSHWKTGVRKQTSAGATNQVSQNQPIVLNPATLPVNREHVRSSTTVINQPVRNTSDANESTASADSDSTDTDINLMETENSKCYSCILRCFVRC